MNPQLAAVQLHDLPCQRQAEADATLAPADLNEGFEDPRLLFEGDPFAFVLHADDHLFAMAARL